MSLYLYIAIIAYSLLAINGIIDKFLLSKAVKSPAVYAFFIGITAPLTLVLAPFGLKWISGGNLLVAIIGGASFVLALYYLYSATQQTSISRILPIEGGLVPVFTLFLSYLILGERLQTIQLLAFVFLVAGAILISLKKSNVGWHPQALKNAIIAAALFALSLTLTKFTFDKTNFVSGLIYTRFGFLLASLSFLLSKQTRYAVFNAPKSTSSGNKLLYYGARISGGVAGFLQNYAISLGSVTIVNAMQGTQYALLLAGTVVLSKKYPHILKEKITKKILAQKIIAIILISLGLLFLTIANA